MIQLEVHDILSSLEDPSNESKLSALEALSTSIKERGGSLALGISDLKPLFHQLKSLLHDTVGTDIPIMTIKVLRTLVGTNPPSDVMAMINQLLPHIIAKMGDPKPVIRKEVGFFFQIFSEHLKDKSSFVLNFIQYGIESEDWKIRKGSIEIVQDLFRFFHDQELSLLLISLVGRLRDISDVVIEQTIIALGKMRHNVGHSKFEEILSELPALQKQLYSQQAEKIEAYKPGKENNANQTLRSRPTSAVVRKPKEENQKDLVFGFVPSYIITSLNDSSDWKTRAEAIEKFQTLMQTLDDPSALTIAPAELISFILGLIEDPNFKINVSALIILSDLVVKIGLSIKSHLANIVPKLIDKFSETKLILKQIIFKILQHLMNVLTPKPVLALILRHLTHENVKVREEIINCICMTLLQFPSFVFDWTSLILEMKTLIKDPRTRIRFVATETLAVIAKRIGKESLISLLNNYELDAGTIHLLQVRFENPLLPFVNSDSCVEHVLNRSQSVASRPNSSIIDDFYSASARASPEKGYRQLLNSATVNLSLQVHEIPPPSRRSSHQNNSGAKNVASAPSFSTRAPPTPRQRAESGSTVIQKSTDDAKPSWHNERPVTGTGTSKTEGKFPWEKKEHLKMPSTPSPMQSKAIASLPQHQTQKTGHHGPYSYIEMMKDNDKNTHKESSKVPNFKELLSIQNNIERNTTELRTPPSPKALNLSTRREQTRSKRPIPTVSLTVNQTPQVEFQQALMQLKGSPDWQIKCQALNTVRFVISKDPEVVTDIHGTTLAVLDEVMNLRSQVSRNAISALQNMFSLLKKSMDPELDIILQVVLKKATDGSQFIHEEIDRCLSTLAECTSFNRILSALLHNAEHKSAQVRAKIAKLVDNLFDFQGQSQFERLVKSQDCEKLITIILVPLCFDSNQDARFFARKSLLKLMEYSECSDLVEKQYSLSKTREIRDALENCKQMQMLSGTDQVTISLPCLKSNSKFCFKYPYFLEFEENYFKLFAYEAQEWICVLPLIKLDYYHDNIANACLVDSDFGFVYIGFIYVNEHQVGQLILLQVSKVPWLVNHKELIHIPQHKTKNIKIDACSGKIIVNLGKLIILISVPSFSVLKTYIEDTFVEVGTNQDQLFMVQKSSYKVIDLQEPDKIETVNTGGIINDFTIHDSNGIICLLEKNCIFCDSERKELMLLDFPQLIRIGCLPKENSLNGNSLSIYKPSSLILLTYSHIILFDAINEEIVAQIDLSLLPFQSVQLYKSDLIFHHEFSKTFTVMKIALQNQNEWKPCSNIELSVKYFKKKQKKIETNLLPVVFKTKIKSSGYGEKKISTFRSLKNQNPDVQRTTRMEKQYHRFGESKIVNPNCGGIVTMKAGDELDIVYFSNELGTLYGGRKSSVQLGLQIHHLSIQNDLLLASATDGQMILFEKSLKNEYLRFSLEKPSSSHLTEPFLPKSEILSSNKIISSEKNKFFIYKYELQRKKKNDIEKQAHYCDKTTEIRTEELIKDYVYNQGIFMITGRDVCLLDLNQLRLVAKFRAQKLQKVFPFKIFDYSTCICTSDTSVLLYDFRRKCESSCLKFKVSDSKMWINSASKEYSIFASDCKALFYYDIRRLGKAIDCKWLDSSRPIPFGISGYDLYYGIANLNKTSI